MPLFNNLVHRTTPLWLPGRRVVSSWRAYNSVEQKPQIAVYEFKFTAVVSITESSDCLKHSFYFRKFKQRLRGRRLVSSCWPCIVASAAAFAFACWCSRAHRVRNSWASRRRCSSVLCAYFALFLVKCANLCDSVNLLLEGVAVPVSGTRVFNSNEPRCRRVVEVEALVVGTLLGGVTHLLSSTPRSSEDGSGITDAYR